MARKERTFQQRKPHRMRTKLAGTGELAGGSETNLGRLSGAYLGNSRVRAREALNWVRDMFNAGGALPGFSPA